MQRYKITRLGGKVLGLPIGTMIVMPSGNVPAQKIWKPYGKPFGKSIDLLKHIK